MEPISKKDFYFDLPEERIAKYPLEKRAESKMLVYRNGDINDSTFNQLGDHLEKEDLLVFNNAQVIPARLYFRRKTGALIEILLLEPVEPSSYDEAFSSSAKCSWKCMIGNGKKWKEGEAIQFENTEVDLKATWLNKEQRIVTLAWSNGKAFTNLLDEIGELPLPPYLNRETEDGDYQTYQTVFAKNKGSVAAPTAGLHFTSNLIDDLRSNQIQTAELTLHVGAGTFLPVKTENAIEHIMHREHFEVTRASLEKLISNSARIAVGTTSLRVLESLYWLGIQVQNGNYTGNVLKLEPYETVTELSYKDSLVALRKYMIANDQDVLFASTEIMILPEYNPRSIKALITNFHLPESTLLFLVACVVPDWKVIYNYALDNDYRFLSYGDSSILFKNV